MEQINREYKIKALQLHPDKNPDPNSLDLFRRIQIAKDVLTNESSRRSYDCWLNSRVCIPFEQWQSKRGHSIHWATPRSTKLSIIESQSRPGQGSEFKMNNDVENNVDTHNRSYLEKFRNYEI